MGRVDEALCDITYIWCPRSTQCNNNCRFIKPNGLDNKTRCAAIAPHDYGTQTIVGYWLCGQTAYTALPRHWSGLCARTSLTDHTIVISANNVTKNNHQKRYAILNDPDWGTDVPEEHKLWSSGMKVALSLLRVETLNYRLNSFVNSSIPTTTALADEIYALRLMVLQNRMVLDLLVASKGGVCAMVGERCCRYRSRAGRRNIYAFYALPQQSQHGVFGYRASVHTLYISIHVILTIYHRDRMLICLIKPPPPLILEQAYRFFISLPFKREMCLATKMFQLSTKATKRFL